MSDRDFIILMVYLTCVALVFYRAIDSLKDQVTIRLDRKALQTELERNELVDFVTIDFKFRPFYGFEPLNALSIALRNLSDALPLYIDWDYCAVTDLKRQTKRVVRLPAGMPIDLSQSQVPSIVHPGQTLQEMITAENTFQRDPQASGNALINKVPLVNLAIAKNLSRYDQLTFSLQLLLHQPQSARYPEPSYRYLVNCTFIIERVHWTQRVPVARFVQNLLQGVLPDIPKGESIQFSFQSLIWLLILTVVVLVLRWFMNS